MGSRTGAASPGGKVTTQRDESWPAKARVDPDGDQAHAVTHPTWHKGGSTAAPHDRSAEAQVGVTMSVDGAP